MSPYFVCSPLFPPLEFDTSEEAFEFARDENLRYNVEVQVFKTVEIGNFPKKEWVK
jgi:hypothetical protein